MLWLLLAMVAMVFVTAWAILDAVAWGVVFVIVVVMGGAILGASSDPG